MSALLTMRHSLSWNPASHCFNLASSSQTRISFSYHLLVVVDDLALPFGTLRLRGKGADGGHNGLKNINQLIGSQNYARLRFGIGNDFPEGAQVDYVLGALTPEERILLPERLDMAVATIKAFCLSGLSFAMTNYNNK